MVVSAVDADGVEDDHAQLRVHIIAVVATSLERLLNHFDVWLGVVDGHLFEDDVEETAVVDFLLFVFGGLVVCEDIVISYADNDRNHWKPEVDLAHEGLEDFFELGPFGSHVLIGNEAMHD